MKGRSWAVLKKDDILKLYEYEYKLAQLNALRTLRHGELGDLEVYYKTLNQKANILCDRLIKIFLSAINSWATYHGIVFNKDDLQILSEGVIPPSTEVDKKILDNIHEAWKLLMKAAFSFNLADKFLALNYALHIVHWETGKWDEEAERYERPFPLVGIGEEEYVPNDAKTIYDFSFIDELNRESMEKGMSVEQFREFLDDLSQGKYIPEYEQELRMKADKKLNWYKFSNENIGYHGTSPEKAKQILLNGFETYISYEQFEEYFDDFYNDISEEAQNKINIPVNRMGKVWEKAVIKLAEFWDVAHPDTQIIWIADSQNIAQEFGNAVLKVNLNNMEYFFSDWSHGMCYKYDGNIIPPKYFELI